MDHLATERSPGTRKPQGYWRDFGNIRRELLAFLARQGTPGVMPAIPELRRARLGSLVVAIHKYHGDYRTVAQRLHLRIRQRPKGYWKHFENVRNSVLELVEGEGIAGRMPTVSSLRRAGRGGLAAAIHEYHGNVHQVARRLRLVPARRPRGYWEDFLNVQRTVFAFMAEYGLSGAMPTEAQLRAAGLASLSWAIYRYHGDFHQVARRLHLAMQRTRKRSRPAVAEPDVSAIVGRRRRPRTSSGVREEVASVEETALATGPETLGVSAECGG